MAGWSSRSSLIVAVTGCTTELTSDPGPTLTSTTSTTTTTTIPASTTTSTTVLETTTTAAVTTTLPAGPVDAIVPLLIGGADGGWLNLGEWQFDGWSDAVDAAGDPIAPSIGPGTAVARLEPRHRGRRAARRHHRSLLRRPDRADHGRGRPGARAPGVRVRGDRPADADVGLETAARCGHEHRTQLPTRPSDRRRSQAPRSTRPSAPSSSWS